jgi:hypothetical protein
LPKYSFLTTCYLKKIRKNLTSLIVSSDKKEFQIYNIFNAIKLAVDYSLIQEAAHISITDPRQIKIQQFDCPGYYNDELKASFGFIVPLIIQLSFLFTLLINLGEIVSEKRSKMRVRLSLNIYNLAI